MSRRSPVLLATVLLAALPGAAQAAPACGAPHAWVGGTTSLCRGMVVRSARRAVACRLVTDGPAAIVLGDGRALRFSDAGTHTGTLPPRQPKGRP